MNTIIVRPDESFYKKITTLNYENFDSLKQFITLQPEEGNFLIRPDVNITKKEIEELSKQYPKCSFTVLSYRSFKIKGFITKEWKAKQSPQTILYQLKNLDFENGYKLLCQNSQMLGILLPLYIEQEFVKSNNLDILELSKYKYKIDGKMILAYIARKVCKK